MVGERFHSLTVVLDEENGGVKRKVLVRCDCGKEALVSVNNLRTGNTKSCGCYKSQRIRETFITHGSSNSRLYETWLNMKARCYNKNCASYRFYGAKGVKVSKEWESFVDFKNWAISSGYSDLMTIDRVIKEGDYNSTNCTWVSQSANSKKRWDQSGRRVVSSRHIIFATLLKSFGVSWSECARLFNLKPQTLIAAVHRAEHGESN